METVRFCFEGIRNSLRESSGVSACFLRAANPPYSLFKDYKLPTSHFHLSITISAHKGISKNGWQLNVLGFDGSLETPHHSTGSGASTASHQSRTQKWSDCGLKGNTICRESRSLVYALKQMFE